MKNFNRYSQHTKQGIIVSLLAAHQPSKWKSTHSPLHQKKFLLFFIWQEPHAPTSKYISIIEIKILNQCEF